MSVPENVNQRLAVLANLILRVTLPIGLALAGCLCATAQTDRRLNPAWQISDSTGVERPILARLVVDGRDEEWPFENPLPADSLSTWLDRFLNNYWQTGFYFAAADSISVDSVARAGTDAIARHSIYVTKGWQTTIGRIVITGMTSLSDRAALRAMQTRPGAVLDPEVLQSDLEEILKRYERDGFVLAAIRVDEIGPSADGADKIDVRLHVEEGSVPRLAAIEIDVGRRTRPKFIGRLTGFRQGQPMRSYDAEAIRYRLEQSGLFKSVNGVSLGIDDNREAILRVNLEEEPPGVFDAVLGYLPPVGESGKGSVVGNVNVVLHHAMGGGRRFGFRFNRLPARVTRFNVEAQDPYLAGLPLNVGVAFDGLQQDSAYGTRRFRVEGGYRILEGLETVASVSRELTRPGSDTTSMVPRSNTWYAGIGFRYRRVDRPSNPTRGLSVDSHVESGRKVRSTRRLNESGVVEFGSELVRQQRLRLESRGYVPVRTRQVAVIGLDVLALQARSYDESDLFRLGGARSLRGYNEEQFFGNVTTRALAEWRYLLDPTSFIFLFLDLGYYSRPEADTGGAVRVEQREFLQGYGFGMQFGTNAGLFTLSLALNPDEGLSAKVHVGMALGL